ncbi:MAG: hypothetical protein LC777_00175 [Actinobacteria bacterium]|nr:hypothetical protein [Actinomycetota bacterium]
MPTPVARTTSCSARAGRPTDARLHTITARELIACASCVVLAAALTTASTHWARVRG